MQYSPSGIPILDLGIPASGDRGYTPTARLVEEIGKACGEHGCFYIRNHGVDHSLIDSFFGDLRSFFQEPLEYKLQCEVSRIRGYIPFGTQSVGKVMGVLDRPNDPLEKLAWGPPYECDPPVEKNVSPEKPPTLKDNATNFHLQMRDLADTLGRILAIAIKAPDEDYFYRYLHDAPHLMIANWYPAGKPESVKSERFGEHFDVTPFTILPTDDCPKSLQIKRANGDWVYADPVPGALFIIIGDVMQRWTNDKWKAAIHQVVWPEGDDIPARLAVAYFIRMNRDSVIECLPSCCQPGEAPKYDPIGFFDYYVKRTNNALSAY